MCRRVCRYREARSNAKRDYEAVSASLRCCCVLSSPNNASSAPLDARADAALSRLLISLPAACRLPSAAAVCALQAVAEAHTLYQTEIKAEAATKASPSPALALAPVAEPSTTT